MFISSTVSNTHQAGPRPRQQSVVLLACYSSLTCAPVRRFAYKSEHLLYYGPLQRLRLGKPLPVTSFGESPLYSVAQDLPSVVTSPIARSTRSMSRTRSTLTRPESGALRKSIGGAQSLESMAKDADTPVMPMMLPMVLVTSTSRNLPAHCQTSMYPRVHLVATRTSPRYSPSGPMRTRKSPHTIYKGAFEPATAIATTTAFPTTSSPRSHHGTRKCT